MAVRKLGPARVAYKTPHDISWEIGGLVLYWHEWHIEVGKIQSSDWDSSIAAAYEALCTASDKRPIMLQEEHWREGGRKIFVLYRGNIYKFNREGYSEEEMLLEINELEDRERRKFEKLRKKLSSANDEEPRKRDRIPEEVRIAVWRRDEGKCSRCGSKEFLEYDHIVPISKGGSNTIRNVELLCERCNRSKRDNIQ